MKTMVQIKILFLHHLFIINKLSIYTLILFLFFQINLLAQPGPVIVLNKTYGTPEPEVSRQIRQTPDGGYAIAGDATFNGNHDFYLIKTDASGNMEWDNRYGYDDFDRMQWAMENGMQILYNNDGSVNGYVMVGTTTSYAGHGEGGLDFMLVRTDENGTELWKKNYGGISDDYGRVVRHTSDGGFVMTGLTHSFGVAQNDFYLVKTDANGNLEWDATYNMTSWENAYDVIEIADGYLLIGTGTQLLKVDLNGDPDPNFGDIPAQPGQGTKFRHVYNYYRVVPAGGSCFMFRPEPGGFVGCGTTGNDAFIFKLNAQGHPVAGWPKIITGPGTNSAYVIHPTDGAGGPGYMVAGETNGIGSGNWDFWLFRTDSNGNVLWQETYGGAGNEWCTGMAPTADGDFALTGVMTSFGQGMADFWLLKIREVINPANISGRVYWDDQDNCLFEPNNEDFGLARQNLQLAAGPYIGLTDGQGNYSLTVEPGSYSIEYTSNGDFELADCQSASPFQITVQSGDNSTGNDFAMQPLSGPQCLSSTSVVSAPFLAGPCTAPLTLSSPCFGYQHKYLFRFCNDATNGTINLNKSEIQIVLSPGMTYSLGSLVVTCDGGNSSFGDPETSFGPMGEQILFWDSDNLSGTIKATKCCVLEITVDVSATADVPFFADASFDAWCDGSSGGSTNVSGGAAKNNDACSCDPNDLTVHPKGCGPSGNIEPSQELIYRVRFENIGTGPAHNIVVRDVLSPHLNLNSLHLFQSSHPVTGVQIDPGNELVVFFNEIELPAGGKGEFFFSLKQMPNLPEGTVITNQADIYFDYNNPVTTNSTVNTIREMPSPEAAFSFIRGGCSPSEHVFDFQYTGSTQNGAIYLWDFGSCATPSSSSAQNPTGIVFNGIGQHDVTLTVMRFGCTATATETINIEDISCGNNGNKVLLCHIPGGNPNNAQTICVSPNAVDAHLAHGDSCGPCETANQQLLGGNNSTNAHDHVGKDFRVFPNPASETVHIDLNRYVGQQVSISILNHLGQRVLYLAEQELPDTLITLDFSEKQLPDGIYLLSVRTAEGQEVKQFVIAR